MGQTGTIEMSKAATKRLVNAKVILGQATKEELELGKVLAAADVDTVIEREGAKAARALATVDYAKGIKGKLSGGK